MFLDLLKYLRRREHLTQLELSITVGYSEAQIGRLEQNQRQPDLTALKALFIPALHLEDEPELTARFLELADPLDRKTHPRRALPHIKDYCFLTRRMQAFSLAAKPSRRISRSGLRISPLIVPSRFLAVVGASGSGKSSLVRAGLAVALQRAGWEIHIFTPTADPSKTLECNWRRIRIRPG